MGGGHLQGSCRGQPVLLERSGHLGRLLTHSWWCHNPSRTIRYKRLWTRASFLIIVEKDAVFQRLLEESVFVAGLPPFIMVTGRGVPDLATRQLVYRLTTEFSLPTFILTDCDLHIWHRDCPHHSSFRRERALGGSRCGVKQSWQEALLMPPASCLTELLTRKRVILQDRSSLPSFCGKPG